MQSNYRHIRVERQTEAVGAELSGFDASRPLPDEVFAEIRRAFIDHYVIVIRDQKLTPDALCAFAQRFGPPTKTSYLTPKDGHPFVVSLTREADTDKSVPVVGGRWHSDGAFMEEVPLGSMLYAVEVPPEGGDTHFVSLERAYEALSPGMKELAERLFIINYPTVFDPEKNVLPNIWKGKTTFDRSADSEPLKECPHPLVCFHPESGRKLLRMAGFLSVRFKDMTEEESKPLMEFFQGLTERQQKFTVKWTKGTVVLWDNRAVQHKADNNYPGYRREMWRTQIGGPRLYGPALPQAQVSRPERESRVAA